MLRVFGGAVMVIAGVAAFIEAHSHRHMAAAVEREYSVFVEHYVRVSHAASGLSQTAYDLLRIGAWALVIVGALIVVTGLIAYFAAQNRPSMNDREAR